MLPPEPYTYRCLNCGWHKTLAPKSDALTPSDTFSHCPNCRGKNLEKEQATGLERAVAKIKRQLNL